MPFIEINGKKVEAEAGSMIIEVADSLNVQIPRFCYHKKLSIAANCRMCLVEVERAPKPLPACATPVTEGMKIWTRSPKALLAQKTVMEFLLINHPLDCPICDQGGECELQDLSIGYGKDLSRYSESKRVVKDKDIGPLIATDMTRCIQCTRCVRFGAEIAGVRELGATGRGECMEIGTYIEQSVKSELSANVIDICPVGALTSKPFRFTARGWELKQMPSISPHDCIGSNIFVHSRRHQVMRIVPRENESINEIWISDRDRFSYEALYCEDRLQHPKLRREGEWQTVSWQEALEFTAEKLLEFINEFHPSTLGALASPNSTLEEFYLLQKLMRGLGTDNVDHRLRQSDFRHQKGDTLFPHLGMAISEIEQCSRVLLVGSNIRKEQPILGLKLRKMIQSGGKALVVNPIDFDFNFEVAAKSITPAGDLVNGLAKIAKALIELTKATLEAEVLQWVTGVKPNPSDREMAELLMEGDKKLILIGALAISHPSYSQLWALAHLIARLSGARVGVLTDGANSAGAWLAGCVPQRLPGGKSTPSDIGFNAAQMLDEGLEAYLLFNIDPEYDCLNGLKALQVLQKAKFVVAITPFESKALLEIADVILPMAPFSETAGTFVNVEGKWQSFKAIVPSLGESRPAWKILRVLGNLCQIPGFEYETSLEVLEAIQAEVNGNDLKEVEIEYIKNLEVLTEKDAIIRIAPLPLYANDMLVRRSSSLQKTEDAGDFKMRINHALASDLKLIGNHAKVSVDGVSITLPFVIDESVPDQSVLIASGIEETILLGGPYAYVQIKPV